jgi:toxin FitB
VSYLLDTNVLSERMRPQPDKAVVAWLDLTAEDSLFISVVTLAELRYGAERLPRGARRNRFDAWLRDDVVARFAGRILHVDEMVADRWGRIMALGAAKGRPMQDADAIIAATADVLDLTIVTRNVSDFEAVSERLLDPWSL